MRFNFTPMATHFNQVIIAFLSTFIFIYYTTYKILHQHYKLPKLKILHQHVQMIRIKEAKIGHHNSG